MKKIILNLLTLTMFFFVAGNSFSQSVIPTSDELILPQYMVNGTTSSKRIQYLCMLKLTGLSANSSYHYYTGADSASTKTGATVPGNLFSITDSNGTYGHINGYSSSKGMAGTFSDYDEWNSTSGNSKYSKFTTNSSGEYSGWFSVVPTSNKVFNKGNDVYFYIFLNDGAGDTSVSKRFRTSSTIRMLKYSNSTGTKDECSAIRGNSLASPETFVLLYDDTAGTGRPIAGTWTEKDGIASLFSSWYAPVVDTVDGAWGAVIPNDLANGIRRIESRDFAGGVLYKHLSSNGMWGSGVNTTNPGNDTIPLVITVGDAPLGASSPDLSFSSSSSSVNENAGTISITVNISSSNPNKATTVDVSAIGGTASSGTDYTFSTQTLTFAAGSSSPQTATLSITDDAFVEGAETIIFSLKNANNSATYSVQYDTIVITDNDAPQLKFSNTTQTINENGGTISSDIEITNADPNNATSVVVDVIGGTASSTTDFTFTKQTVTFAAGSSAKQTVNILISDDAITEDNETIFLQLQNATNNANITSSIDTLIITDNDHPSVSFANATMSAGENTGTITVTANISNPHPSMATNVNVAITGGTAPAGDYSYSTQTISFAAGSTTAQTVNFTLVNNSNKDGDRTVIFSLQNATNNSTYGTQNLTLTIIDDDTLAATAPKVNFTLDTASVAEGGTATISVSIANPAATATTIDVDLGTGGTAVLGTDFNFIKQTLTFAATSTTPQTCTVQTLSDMKISANKTIVFTLKNPSTGVAIGTPSNFTLTINEDGKNGISTTVQPIENIYPNPVKNELYLSLSQKTESRLFGIKIYSSEGKLYIAEKISSPENIYITNTEHLPSGLYIIEITSANSTFFGKFVKE